jgi:hypothetical protein
LNNQRQLLRDTGVDVVAVRGRLRGNGSNGVHVKVRDILA